MKAASTSTVAASGSGLSADQQLPESYPTGQLMLFLEEPEVSRLPDGAIRLSKPRLANVIRKGRVSEACKILGVSDTTVVQLIRESEIHGWKKTNRPGSWWEVDLGSVYAYRQKQMAAFQL